MSNITISPEHFSAQEDKDKETGEKLGIISIVLSSLSILFLIFVFINNYKLKYKSNKIIAIHAIFALICFINFFLSFISVLDYGSSIKKIFKIFMIASIPVSFICFVIFIFYAMK